MGPNAIGSNTTSFPLGVQPRNSLREPPVSVPLGPRALPEVPPRSAPARDPWARIGSPTPWPRYCQLVRVGGHLGISSKDARLLQGLEGDQVPFGARFWLGLGPGVGGKVDPRVAPVIRSPAWSGWPSPCPAGGGMRAHSRLPGVTGRVVHSCHTRRVVHSTVGLGGQAQPLSCMRTCSCVMSCQVLAPLSLPFTRRWPWARC